MATADPRNAHATGGVPDRAVAGSSTTAPAAASEHRFGPHAAAILSLVTTYMLHRATQTWLLLHFLVNTPTIVATWTWPWRRPSPCCSCRSPRHRWPRSWPAGGGVPGGLGNAVSAAAALSPPAPRHDAHRRGGCA